MFESTSSNPIDLPGSQSDVVPSASEPSAPDSPEQLPAVKDASTTGAADPSANGPETPEMPAHGADTEALNPPAPSSDLMKLTARQVLALKCLMNGVSITDAAITAKVGRTTIHRWITEHPGFRAAYNRWVATTQLSTQSRLIAMQDLAVEVMCEELETKRNGRIAAMLLTKMGVLSPQTPGAIEPKRAGKEIEVERQRRDVALARSATDADMAYFVCRDSEHLIRDDAPPASSQEPPNDGDPIKP